MAENETLPVAHNLQARRFEIKKDDYLAVLKYELLEGKIIFSHTGVPDALGGQGIGSRLAKAGLDYAKQNRLQVVALCSFISAYINKHPEYRELLP